MAGCELNIYNNAPAAHRMRHDSILTSADEFDASRRRRCVEDDDVTAADRDAMIPHYRLVPNAFAPGGTGEWVTLSKSVLLQLVERICQLSFQTDSLTATAACPSASLPSDRLETSMEVLMDPVKSTELPSSVVEAEQLLLTGATSDDVVATASTSDVVEMSNIDGAGELIANDHEDVDDIPTWDKASASVDKEVVASQELSADTSAQDSICDDDDDDDDENDSEVFTGPVTVQQYVKTENSSLSMDSSPSMLTSSDISASDDTVVSDASLAITQKPPLSPSTSLRSTQLLRVDRRRRLRELRRLRRHRHRQATVAVDDQSRDRCRERRRDAVVRRRFAVPRQLPQRFHDRHIADVEYRSDGMTADAPLPMRLPVSCRYGRMSQPWSALNKVVVCQLVDIVLSQELAPTKTTWRSAIASVEKRRSSATIWNPAITPETRECCTPAVVPSRSSVNDLSSLVCPSSAEPCSSTLLQSLLSPMAAAAVAATSYLDRRRSDMLAVDAEVGGGSLAWTVSQSSSGRRRHHSAVTPDTFHAPWTSPPSFFWYNVPPPQGNFLLLPDAATRPCYRWPNAAESATTLSTSGAEDACALDYRVQALDTSGCPDAVDNQAPVPPAAGSAQPRRRSNRLSTPPSSVSGRRATGARLKWVVVNKTDVCSLFESLASSMVTDGDEQRPSSDETSGQSTTGSGAAGADQRSRAAVSGGGCGREPVKWKSTLLRRARAEAQRPSRSGSVGDVAENAHVSFDADC